MKKTVVVNVYNFIRMSHTEPSTFMEDDFDTIRREIITVKQFGFPGTYALKYDALMEPRYQALLKQYLDDADEISAWWEITRELCVRSGVSFRDSFQAETYDDRVDSAYSMGYTPRERCLLVDGYMADFYAVFGKYPQSIGSWVLDSVTMAYAREHYGVEAFAICRDQMGVDGFTLWGGYPNGAYYPSVHNEFMPAQSLQAQIDAPVFRLLGPDPIYNFEADVREDLPGVYSLEPAWITGRDPKWIRWIFGCLTEEDTIGMGYAQVGQENNFLWENIQPGLAPQLEVLKELQEAGKLRVEPMVHTARRFREKYRVTPPATFQASRDWSERDLSCQWYSSANYRMGLLHEDGCLRIRDVFLYDEKYPSRYLSGAMKGTKSTFDALPVLFPQQWMSEAGARPFIRLMDSHGAECKGGVRYEKADSLTAKALLETGEGTVEVLMKGNSVCVTGATSLRFDALPVYTGHTEKVLRMRHCGYDYALTVLCGSIVSAGCGGVEIQGEEKRIVLSMGPDCGCVWTQTYLDDPAKLDDAPVTLPSPKISIPPFAPVLSPAECVFPWGSPARVKLSSRTPGKIHYTLDGSIPDENAPVYFEPILLTGDTQLRAILVTSDGKKSEQTCADYRFGLKSITLESETALDGREVFCGNGWSDLLESPRGTLDYLDGTWRGTLESLDITGTLDEMRETESICVGFLSHHRSGIIYPEKVELFVGEDKNSMQLLDTVFIPNRRGEREIEKRDVCFRVDKKVGAFRVVAHRYARMPKWCTYRGAANVFTMTDNLILKPKK